MKPAIYSACMPEYDVAFAAQKIKEWGYEAVEWRVTEVTEKMATRPISYWGRNKAVIDFNDFLKNAAETKKICDDQGLTVCAVDFSHIYPDLEKTRTAVEGATILGADKLVFKTATYNAEDGYDLLYGQSVEYLSRVQDMVKDAGCLGLIETHEGSISPSPSLIKRVIENFDPQHMGIVFDPGNMIYEGLEQWDMGLDILKGWIKHVHVKNSGWKEVNTAADGNVEWQSVSATLLGGIVNWVEMIKKLHAHGYDGWLSVEDLSQLRTTEVKLKDDYLLLTKLLDAL